MWTEGHSNDGDKLHKHQTEWDKKDNAFTLDKCGSPLALTTSFSLFDMKAEKPIAVNCDVLSIHFIPMVKCLLHLSVRRLLVCFSECRIVETV